ncbi:MAG: UDP-N-acetylglucosamine 1-carboxyvinyltransferase [Verrucomicrobiota bacterium]|nr:UDP-N-acetylglucosamine 1-carboxyvinyltransferase [Verrucomicrobiota bacterium]
MDKFIIEGGTQLNGTLKVSGSKNSALPILAATVLTRGISTIRNVPQLSDIRFMLQILKYLGAVITFEDGVVTIDAAEISSVTPYDLVRKMRASVCLLGPILARNKEVTISLPGGCVIGDRPIDIHLRGIEALGAEVTSTGGNIHAAARELVGTEVNMGGKFGSTVLGTDNIMMAATLAKGTTVIEQAACEPEVVDLANLLNKMGAKITGAGTRTIVIEGVKELNGVEYDVIPDRIEAGTFLVAVAATGGTLTLEGVDVSHQSALLAQLKQCKAQIEVGATSITIKGQPPVCSLEILTETYPGFPTDMQAQMCALLTVTKGISFITEKIYPNRFMHVSELKRLGSDIKMEGATAIIRGVPELIGAPVMASDLRASAALVIAGLMAKGRTEINRVYHIDRGYEQIDKKLNSVGARILRAKDTEP